MPRRAPFELVAEVDTPEVRAWLEEVTARMLPVVEEALDLYLPHFAAVLHCAPAFRDLDDGAVTVVCATCGETLGVLRSAP